MVIAVITFLAGIVLGALAVALWMQSRAVAAEGRAAAAETRCRELVELGSVEARIGSVTNPLSESLNKLEAHVREFEARRQHAFGGIENQLLSLSKETVLLSNALRAPQSRGRWGELTLRRVVELAGMAKHCDFYEQETVNGRLRPDMLVRLPGGRVVAVDAKAPLAAYQDAVGALDDAGRKACLLRHAQMVARHIDMLAAKQYWAQIQPSPEIVVLFLPGDHFLSAALEANPELVEMAIAQKIVLATPATLVSVLAGVAHGWRQLQVAENAEEIRKTAADLYERLGTWQGYYAGMGAALNRAVADYNRSVGSWDARVQPSLRRIREMGAGLGNDPAAFDPVDVVTRVPKALEAGASQ